VFGGLLYADCRLDGFIDCHGKTFVHSIQKARNTRRGWQVLRSFYYGYAGFFKKQANRRTTPFQKTGQKKKQPHTVVHDCYEKTIFRI